MKHSNRYQPFFAATVMLCVLVILFYPYLKYYIDPDATAYLTISRRYADGDYAKAINAYWSPWSCWLTAIGIKLGFGVMRSAIIANTLAGIGLLFVTQLFFLKYSIDRFSQWALQLALMGFLSYAVYYQNFDDLWECFFLLYALRITISHKFCYTPLLWVAAGVFGALAYFAKAYSFPFFIVSTLFLVFYHTRAWKKRYIIRCLKISAVVIGVMIFLSAPWIYALHHKYGQWMTSTAGTLNMSWYLVGHPEWKQGIQYLIPPVYASSPTYWEDPWYANGVAPHFWDSTDLFIRQLMKIGINAFKFVISSMQISVAFLLVVVYTVAIAVRRIKTSKYKVYYCIITPFLIFPLPFFLINFEARYIWYMLPLSMLLGVLIIRKNDWYKKWLIALFALSYVIYPVYGIAKMWNEGKEEYEFAQQLKKQEIKGSFASNIVFGMAPSTATQRLAYFSGNAYYIMPQTAERFQHLLPELRKHGVQYYYYYPKYNPYWKIVDERGRLFIQLQVIRSDGMQLYKLQSLQTNEEFLNEIMQLAKERAKRDYGLLSNPLDSIIQTLVSEAKLPSRTSEFGFYIGKSAKEIYGNEFKKYIKSERSIDEILTSIDVDTIPYKWKDNVHEMHLVPANKVHIVYQPWSDSSLTMTKRVALFNKYWHETKPFYDVSYISKPYYDQQRSYAAIYRGGSVSSRAGGGCIYIYKHIKGKWVLLGTTSGWIS